MNNSDELWIHGSLKTEKDLSIMLLQEMHNRGMSPAVSCPDHPTLIAAVKADNSHLLADLLSNHYPDSGNVKKMLNFQDDQNCTVLMYAARFRDGRSVHELLKEPDIDLGPKTTGNHTALTIASSCGDYEIAKILLYNIKMEEFLGPRKTKDSPALSAGTVEQPSSMGEDPALCYACYKGHKRIVELFLDDGRIDLNMRYFSHTVLHFAVIYGKRKAHPLSRNYLDIDCYYQHRRRHRNYNSPPPLSPQDLKFQLPKPFASTGAHERWKFRNWNPDVRERSAGVYIRSRIREFGG